MSINALNRLQHLAKIKVTAADINNAFDACQKALTKSGLSNFGTLKKNKTMNEMTFTGKVGKDKIVFSIMLWRSRVNLEEAPEVSVYWIDTAGIIPISNNMYFSDNILSMPNLEKEIANTKEALGKAIDELLKKMEALTAYGKFCTLISATVDKNGGKFQR